MSEAEIHIRFSETGLRAQEPEIARLMAEALGRPGLLSLAAGFTDNTILPVDLVQEAVNRLSKSGLNEHLQYGTNTGRPGLRKAVAELMRAENGESLDWLDAEHVGITTGSQQALYLIAQVLCNPGDIVLVEQPSYFVFLDLLRGMGVQAVSIPCNDDGSTDIAGFRKLIGQMRSDGRWQRVKLLYLVTYYANPSTRCMGLEEKRQLGDLLRALAHGIPVMEDGAYRQLYYGTPPEAPSVLSLPEYEGLPLIYLGSFSKAFSSGLKVGYIVSRHRQILRQALRVKAHHDFGTSNFCQAVLEEVLSSGKFQSYLEVSRAHYQQKAEVLDAALRSAGLPELGWSWETPQGGLLFWLRGPEGLDASANGDLCRACLEQNVLYVPGDLCFADRSPLNFVRLSTGALSLDQLREAAARFGAAARQVSAT